LRGFYREVDSISSANYLVPLQIGAPDELLNQKYSTVSNKSYKDNNQLLLKSYLAGLFEGQGDIHFTKSNPVISITAHMKDKPLLDAIMKSIGLGRVRLFKKDQTVRLDITNNLEV